VAEELVAVDAEALGQLLQALVGEGHLVRELQTTRGLHKLGHPNPIETLIEQVNSRNPRTLTTAQLSQAERTELLDWVSACQSRYRIDSTPGHRFDGPPGNLQENRTALVLYVNELLAKRAGCVCIAQASPSGVAASAQMEPT